ncbi:hypothetical protein MYAM1_003578 [Malassezia yamatoensis]|uniref:Peroxin-5 n=1 Tax=Malassezia yamatoensis TaxID=253288 RepID=A0AAJ5Z1Y4_9BASI|nr:hypothetical protein MYAM1_003578 [Malassezia yamatoensis]
MSLIPLKTYAANPSVKRGFSTKLGVSPKGDRLVYVQGRCVFLRDLEDPAATLVYTGHTHPVTVARISPSGFYAASADTSGSVRVWDLASGSMILKLQTQCLSGAVKDLAWDSESKRIIVVGEGRERFGSAISFDTGSSVGEISGHSKVINAVAIRHQRPFRAVTAGDDLHLVFYTGNPYKFHKTLTGHTRFVQDVQYAPDGTSFASVGSDGQLIVYDGVSGDTLQTVQNAHNGTIYAVHYAPDSQHLVTVGADGFVRVWNGNSCKLVTECDTKSNAVNPVDAQQVGVVWAKPDLIISIGLEGALLCFAVHTDASSPSLQLQKSFIGATNGVSGLAMEPSSKLAAASVDGRVYLFDEASSVQSYPQQSGAPSITGICADLTTTYTIALDDTLTWDSKDAPRIRLSAQPRKVAACGGTQWIANEHGLDVVQNNSVQLVSKEKLDIPEPTAVDVCAQHDSNANTIAVGTSAGSVHLFSSDWQEITTFTNNRSTITALAISPNQQWLAAGDASGKILVYDLQQNQQLRLSQWVFHSGRITALNWSQDSLHCSSASLDTHVYVWSVERPMKHAVYKNAHAGGATGVAWTDSKTLASSGADGIVRTKVASLDSSYTQVSQLPRIALNFSALEEMLGGGAECGPVNPLQQIGKRLGEDRSTQFDSHRGNPQGYQHAPAGFRTARTGNGADLSRFEGGQSEHHAPFHVDQLRNALPAMEKHQFGHSSSIRPQNEAPAMTPAWARDFMQFQPAVRASPSRNHASGSMSIHSEQSQRTNSYVSPHGITSNHHNQPWTSNPPPFAMMHANRSVHHAKNYAPAFQENVQSMNQQQPISSSSWDSAFSAIDVDVQQQTTNHASISDASQQDAVLDKMDADELAETASRLLHSVQDDASNKFQQSEFLNLMRKLRDRQAEVQGTSIVENGKGKSKDAPTQADLDAMIQQKIHTMQQDAPATSSAAPERYASQLDHDRVPDYSDLQEFWAQEDAARAHRDQIASQSQQNAFVGDSGDIQARMREDQDAYRSGAAQFDAAHMDATRSMQDAHSDTLKEDAIAAEFKKWNQLGANVSGTKQNWEEDIMTQSNESQEQHDEDFVGRAWTGTQGAGHAGAQQREWAQLQSDWDQWDAQENPSPRNASDAMNQATFPYEAPTYRFHDANPYLQRTYQHAMHMAPDNADGVLEHEAAVQQDPTKADAWYNLGVRQQENERESQAIAALRKAVGLDPSMKDAWLALAVSYTNENDRNAAMEAISRWISSNSQYADVVQKHASHTDDRPKQLAGLLIAMARSSAADKTLDADVQVALGVLFNSCGEYDKAVDCFTAALHARPDDWLLYNRIGATLSNSGRSRESLKFYQDAIALRPGFARCHFNLSISCLNLKMYQDAAEHAYIALALQHASDQEQTPEELRGAQNRSLWEILRVSLELMQRPDLASKCEARDVDAIRLEEIVPL